MTTISPTLGRVQELWRYPVKSMLGERRELIDLNARGVEGDRTYAIRDATGKFGSGKNTRRFRKIDGLFKFRAVYEGAMLTIHFPDGRTITASDPNIHAALSSELKQSVTLAAEADVSHLDAAPVHLLTTGSLAWLAHALPESRVDGRRFRPNVIIEIPDHAPLEHTWVSKQIEIGSAVKLRVIQRTERCGMVAMAQRELPDDPRILRHITEYAGLEFGVYAEVAAPGRVRCGDVVTLVD